jgi:UDP-2,3-diacylglucosamine hydrolase
LNVLLVKQVIETNFGSAVMKQSLGQVGRLESAELVVVSDVHLRQPDDQRSQILMGLIGQLSKSTEYFVLNGDIFDFCFGDSAYFRRKFEALGAALADAVKRGVKVIFIEGNHEFHMEELGWDHVEIIKTHSRPVQLKSGMKIKIGHGDLITDDKAYKAFRGLVKSGFARAIAKRMPGSWLDGYALKHAKVSRSQDKYRKLDHQRILSAFERFLDDGDHVHGIIGHYHVPYAESRSNGKGMMLSVDSWDVPNALVFAQGNFYRLFFQGSAENPRVEIAKSIFHSSP